MHLYTLCMLLASSCITAMEDLDPNKEEPILGRKKETQSPKSEKKEIPKIDQQQEEEIDTEEARVFRQFNARFSGTNTFDKSTKNTTHYHTHRHIFDSNKSVAQNTGDAFIKGIPQAAETIPLLLAKAGIEVGASEFVKWMYSPSRQEKRAIEKQETIAHIETALTQVLVKQDYARKYIKKYSDKPKIAQKFKDELKKLEKQEAILMLRLLRATTGFAQQITNLADSKIGAPQEEVDVTIANEAPTEQVSEETNTREQEIHEIIANAIRSPESSTETETEPAAQ